MPTSDRVWGSVHRIGSIRSAETISRICHWGMADGCQYGRRMPLGYGKDGLTLGKLLLLFNFMAWRDTRRWIHGAPEPVNYGNIVLDSTRWSSGDGETTEEHSANSRRDAMSTGQ